MQLVHRRRFPIDHYVLVDRDGHIDPQALIAEARRQAEALAKRSTGDAANFTLIQNGARLARLVSLMPPKAQSPHKAGFAWHERSRVPAGEVSIAAQRCSAMTPGSQAGFISRAS